MKVLESVSVITVTKETCVMTAQINTLKRTRMIHTLHARPVTCHVSPRAGRRGLKAVTSVRKAGHLQKRMVAKI